MMIRRMATALLMLVAATAARSGTVHVAREGEVGARLAQLQPGDTLRLDGLFSSVLRLRDRDFGGVTVDASGATLLEGMTLTNVRNISFAGGTWGRSDAATRDWYVIRVDNSRNVALEGLAVVGNGDDRGAGLRIAQSHFVTVRDSLFSDHQNGMQVGGGGDMLITGNQFVRSTRDGIQMINTQRMIVSENSCMDFTPSPMAHPDCIQLWSSGGRLQSDIYLLNNLALGSMQAFASFDPRTLSGTRMVFAGNYAAVNLPHGVSCYGCTDSRFLDNMLITLPEALHKVWLRTPGGSNNEFAGNQVIDLRGQFGAALPERGWSSLVPSLAGQVGSQWSDPSHDRLMQLSLGDLVFAGGGVPEPASWVLTVLGFALIGRSLRRGARPARDGRDRLRRALA